MKFVALRFGAIAVPVAALFAAMGAAGGLGPVSAPTTGASGAPSPSSGQELVYVASISGPVVAYRAGSAGSALPVRSLPDPGDPATYWGPWGVAFDAAGNVYVQSYLANATTFVYPPGATVPRRIFRVTGPDSRAVAVDAGGYAYVASGQGGTAISVAAPGATGTPDDLYTVAELRQIPTDETPFHPWPSILTTDASGHVIAAVVRSVGNAIEVFAGGPSGSGAPVRVIAGPHTGLGSCAVTCDQVAVTYSPLTGRLYVAVSQGEQTHINVYAGTASGDAGPIRVISGPATGLAGQVVTGIAVSQGEQTHINVYAGTASGDAGPIRVISGPATGLAGQVVTGIAVSQVDGSIYALSKPSQFGSPGTIRVFDRFANGNAAPRRDFTDATTGLRDAMGIAIH
jgi:hypothetical protein